MKQPQSRRHDELTIRAGRLSITGGGPRGIAGAVVVTTLLAVAVPCVAAVLGRLPW